MAALDYRQGLKQSAKKNRACYPRLFQDLLTTANKVLNNRENKIDHQ